MKRSIKTRLALFLLPLFVGIICIFCAHEVEPRYIQFIYSSDAHYGLFREFDGRENVSSSEVNRVMIEKMNLLPQLLLPQDGGVKQGKPIRYIDFVINTGDIANRMEDGVQSAASSWNEFSSDWLSGLDVKDKKGEKAPLYLLPGNHDVSNAIGHYRFADRKKDATSLTEIYNRMMLPGTFLNEETYDYSRNKVNYSFSMDGIHFAFVGMWPDSKARKWLDKDLRQLNGAYPCLLFTHDEPDVEAKHLINPLGDHSINATDKFENLLCDTSSVTDPQAAPVKERQQLADFMEAHPVIKAYFHGNTNYNEYYVWRGPENNISLDVFRVDSPMKGEFSSQDDSLLSFQLVVIDVVAKKMTVRECFWNTGSAERPVIWGEAKTISL